MSKNPFALMALAALLAACSAAAQNSATVEQMTAEPALLGGPAAEPAPVAPTIAPAPVERATTARDSAAVSCDVRSRRTADGVVIQARAFADRAFDGEYDLRITKSGGGNSSEISQSGPLALAAGAAATLGENEISLERGARIRAVLTLHDASGELCSRTFRL